MLEPIDVYFGRQNPLVFHDTLQISSQNRRSNPDTQWPLGSLSPANYPLILGAD